MSLYITDESGKLHKIAGAGGGSSITADSELSLTSENPVQNKVVTERFNYIGSQAVVRLSASQVSITPSTLVKVKLDTISGGNNLVFLNRSNNALTFDPRVKRIKVTGEALLTNTNVAVAFTINKNGQELYSTLTVGRFSGGQYINEQLAFANYPMIDVANGDEITFNVWATSSPTINHTITKLYVEAYL